MVFGGVPNEHLQLNECTLWWRTARLHADKSGHISAGNSPLIAEEKFDEALQLGNREMLAARRTGVVSAARRFANPIDGPDGSEH